MLNIDLNAYAKQAGRRTAQIKQDPPPPEPLDFNNAHHPADCSNCPACGTWDFRDYAGKRLCFHRAYYIGKAGKPVDLEIAKYDCPKLETENRVEK